MEIRLLQTGTTDYEAMTSLRYRVLLQPIGVPRSYIDPQREAGEILIGAFEAERLAGCCILTPVDERRIQLRQMAVETSLQKKGVGAAIVAFAEETARAKGFTFLVLNARDTVIDFYKKSGYHPIGDAFTEVGIGHRKMEKKVAP